MKLPRRRFSASGSGRRRAASLVSHCRAEAYPTRPVHDHRSVCRGRSERCHCAHRGRWLCGHRLVSHSLLKTWPGAAGSIWRRPGRARGVRWLHACARHWGTQCRSMRALRDSNYDLGHDFEPVSLLVAIVRLLIVAKEGTMPAKDPEVLIAWLKTNPDKVSSGLPPARAAHVMTGDCLPKGNWHTLQLVPYRAPVPAI